ncbi:hypothetical protein [Bradyrhizobium sp. WYCCWR 12699]|uniref:hypothetical protein n=1 Tax=Bradyrhizobium sp. WYCCWR 12699 TaxID=3064203 RepID=UPI0028A3A2E4|nr:hypothetical protein [Bradyrhizobium sp. WYCCWR 12699]MDT4737660.1 hypothetical protein [Bradyrhizobium sp. WYCCWR 12699]
MYVQKNGRFDRAKDLANVAKHGVSLARWSDMEIRAIVPVGPFDHGDPRYRAYGFIDGIAWCSPFAMSDIDRSACDAPMPRR